MAASDGGAKNPFDSFRELDLSKCTIEERVEVSIITLLGKRKLPIPSSKEVLGYFKSDLAAHLFTKLPLPGKGRVLSSKHQYSTKSVVVLSTPAGPEYVLGSFPTNPLDEDLVMAEAKKYVHGLTDDEKDALDLTDTEYSQLLQ